EGRVRRARVESGAYAEDGRGERRRRGGRARTAARGRLHVGHLVPEARVRATLVTLVAGLAVVAASAGPANAATGECRGIRTCIRVPGPWVLVPAHGRAAFLLSCPRGRSVVGGLDSQASSRAVRVSFEGRIGAPVQPGVT